MNLIKKTINIIFITIILFIVANVILGFAWEIKTSSKLKKISPYTNQVLEILNLSEEEGRTLYLETWINRIYDYDRYTEFMERETPIQKYVNISALNGRKILNKPNCNKSFFFYGSSSTFGYNVTDKQNFPFYFKEILKKKYSNINYCVYNFGRAGYGSTRENILFQKHLLANKIKKDDFIIFLNGNAEGGLNNGLNTKFLYEAHEIITKKHWDMYKITFKMFFESIPINQLIKRIDQKNNKKNIEDKSRPLNEKLRVFQTNVNVRIGICEKFNLNCFTFLQPKSGVHGKQFDKYETKGISSTDMSKLTDEIVKTKTKLFNSFTNIQNVIDISNSLDNETDVSYVDKGHYSPSANKAIANRIYDTIKDKIN